MVMLLPLVVVAVLVIVVLVKMPMPAKKPVCPVEKAIAFHSAGRNFVKTSSSNAADPHSVMIARFAELQKRGHETRFSRAGR